MDCDTLNNIPSIWPQPNTYKSSFHPKQCLGLITDGLASSIITLGQSSFLLTSAGPQYFIYNTNNLKLVFKSPIFSSYPDQNDFEIHSIKADSKHNLIYISSYSSFLVCHRLKVLATIKTHQFKIRGMIIIGSLLFTYSNYEIFIWETDSFSKRLKLNQVNAKEIEYWHPEPFLLDSNSNSNDNRKIFSVSHPATYINKVLIAFQCGDLELWNFRSKKLVYKITCLHQNSFGKILARNVTSIAHSDYPDIIALSFSSGQIYIIDILRDELLLTFFQSQDLGTISALSFFSSNTASKNLSFLLNATSNGSIILWNLDSGQLHSIHKSAHKSKICFVSFLQDNSLLTTLGSDNSIKIWKFEETSIQFRLLKSRTSHDQPINKFEFYDEDCLNLIGSSNSWNGCDLSFISTIQKHQDFTFSKKLKQTQSDFTPLHNLPPILSFVSAHTRHNDWQNIVSCHSNLHQCYTWSGHTKKISNTILQHPHHSSPATALALASCGEIVCVGYKSGSITRFNLQSGRHRGDFIADLYKEEKLAHYPSVSHLETITSSLLISSSTHPNDCCLRIWNLKDNSLNSQIHISGRGYGIETFVISGAIVAVALKSGQLVLCDLISHTCIRNLQINSSINCISFAEDGRLLLAATSDARLVAFDLFTGSLVNYISLPSPALCIKFKNQSHQLFSSHSHFTGIFVTEFHFDYLLRLYMLSTLNHVFYSKHEMTKPQQIQSETTSNISINHSVTLKLKAPSHLSTQLTLSGVNNSKIKSLNYLDRIKTKSKPLTVNSDDQIVPFNLFDTYSHMLQSSSNENNNNKTPFPQHDGSKNILKRPYKDIELFKKTKMQKLLNEEHQLTEKNFEAILKLLRELSASGVFLELSHLGSSSQENYCKELVGMIHFFSHYSRKRKDVDLVQAYLRMFIQIHSESLTSTWFLQSAKADLKELQDLIKSDWTEFDLKLHQLSFLLKFLTHLQMD